MKTYLLAEKCLERSASLYETAGYIGKRDEVLRIQDKVKEKSEFALSLGEVMTTPNVTSSTSAISSPRMTVEEPVGLLKFEKAFIEANIICNKSSVTIGEDFILEIQLANLGKGIAFLTRVDEVIPTEFEVAKRPEKCMVSNQSLTFSPRKLTPLETKEIKFFSISNLPKLLPPPYDEWIQDAHKNNKKIIKKKLSNITYKNLLINFILHPTLVIRFLLSRIGIYINS